MWAAAMQDTSAAISFPYLFPSLDLGDSLGGSSYDDFMSLVDTTTTATIDPVQDPTQGFHEPGAGLAAHPEQPNSFFNFTKTTSMF